MVDTPRFDAERFASARAHGVTVHQNDDARGERALLDCVGDEMAARRPVRRARLVRWLAGAQGDMIALGSERLTSLPPSDCRVLPAAGMDHERARAAAARSSPAPDVRAREDGALVLDLDGLKQLAGREAFH